jgi:hypothetical protein
MKKTIDLLSEFKRTLILIHDSKFQFGSALNLCLAQNNINNRSSTLYRFNTSGCSLHRVNRLSLKQIVSGGDASCIREMPRSNFGWHTDYRA